MKKKADPVVFAPMTELVYVLVLDTKFWEFESPLGHQFFGDVAQW